MNRNMAIGSSAAVFGGLLLAMTAAAQPPAEIAGQIEQCEGCHGAAGISTDPTVPTIAGIPMYVHADYLAAYKDGARNCAEEHAAMCTLAAGLDDGLMELFGEYYGGLPFKPAAQEFEPDRATAGKLIHEERCARCHTDGGSNPDDEASILAGQWIPYLRASLQAFVAGEREQPAKMKVKTETLTEEECEALLHYYASQQ